MIREVTDSDIPVLDRSAPECVAAHACKPQAFNDPSSAATAKPENIEAYRKVSGLHDPAVGVSWDDAGAYCKWRGKRLPTVQEWNSRPGARPRVANWLADKVGSKRAVRGRGSREEVPTARAPWLGFRCASD